MEVIIHIIQIISIGWFIATFSNENLPKINGVIGKVIKCQKCSTLWFGLIYLLIVSPSTFWLAFMCSYIAQILNNKLNNISL